MCVGSAWALGKVYTSLLETSVLHGDWSELTSDLESFKKYEGGVVRKPVYRGSKLSLNLHLRMLLHLYGDLHQPLHNICLFAKGFPEGDYGGNSVRRTAIDVQLGTLSQTGSSSFD